MRSSLYNVPGKSNGREAGGRETGGPQQYEMEEQLRRENEAMLSALGDSVARMKSVAGGLQTEARDQNDFLKSIQNAFTSATTGVNTSISGLQNVMGRYGWKHTVAFGFVLFVVLYVLYSLLWH